MGGGRGRGAWGGDARVKRPRRRGGARGVRGQGGTGGNGEERTAASGWHVALCRHWVSGLCISLLRRPPLTPFVDAQRLLCTARARWPLHDEGGVRACVPRLGRVQSARRGAAGGWWRRRGAGGGGDVGGGRGDGSGGGGGCSGRGRHPVSLRWGGGGDGIAARSRRAPAPLTRAAPFAGSRGACGCLAVRVWLWPLRRWLRAAASCGRAAAAAGCGGDVHAPHLPTR